MLNEPTFGERRDRSARSLLVLGAMAIWAGCRPSSEPPPEPRIERPPRRLAVTPTTAIARYTLRFRRPSTHYIDVTASFPTRGRASFEVMMPVWTPGSYLVREYARHVEAVEATAESGLSREVRKVAKNRFRLDARDAKQVVLRYRVYAREASVRTNFVDADHAVVSPAATFFADVAHLAEPMQVEVELPRDWSDVAVALPRLTTTSTSGGHRFLAADFDELVDSPMVLGRLDRRRFEVQGVPHELVTVGGGDVWNYPRAAADVQTITEAVARFWGNIPYDRYLFLNVLNEGRGGLEHEASTLMMASRWVARDEKRYRGWTGLVAHELFHAWSGKRLRPAALGPFDYERENYTPLLWVVEGFTSYYDDLLRARAGLLSEEQYLAQLAHSIDTVAGYSGERVQSLDAASYDAWIKFYRPNENSRNVSVSYYRKGALLAWVLDARIRRATRNQRSLDDVLRRAYQRFSGERGYSRADLIEIVAQVSTPKVGRWLDAAAQQAKPLDYVPALDWFGLRFEDVEPLPSENTPEARQARRAAAWAGVEVKDAAGRIVVTRVDRDGPGEAAGFNVDDELIAFDRARIHALTTALRRYEPGSKVAVLLARRGKLRTVTLEVGVAPRRKWVLQIDPHAHRSARRHRRSWLSGR